MRRNKHMMIDLGTGNNNKINWAMNNKQELIDIIECIYRGARKGLAALCSGIPQTVAACAYPKLTGANSGLSGTACSC